MESGSRNPVPADLQQGGPVHTASFRATVALSPSCHVSTTDSSYDPPYEAEFSLSSGPDPATDVILRLEAESNDETRAMMRLLHAAIFLGVVSCVTESVLKFVRIPSVTESSYEVDEDALTRDGTIISGVNCAVSIVIICGLTSCLLQFGWRLYHVAARGRSWSRRRARLCGTYFALLVIQFINASMYLVPNVCSLQRSCTVQLVSWAGVLRWSCWNTSFLLLVISAHNTNPAKGGSGLGGDSKLVIDGSWLLHLPKAGWWLACEGNLAYLLWRLYQPNDPENIFCSSPNWQRTSSALIVVGMIVWVLLITYYLGRATRSLQQRPYTAFRVANLIVRLQLRTSFLGSVVIMVSVTLLWFIKEGNCLSTAFTWYGLMSCQIVMAALVVVLALFFMPANESAEMPVMRALMQRFAWTEEHRARVCAERAAQCSSDLQRDAVLAEPVFCFETACKTLYWSMLVYRIQDAAVTAAELAADEQDRAAEGVPSSMAVSTGEALAMYDLTSVQVFRETSVDTKVVVASGADTILIAFRGTASWTNIVKDLQAWLVPHCQVDASNRRRSPLAPRVHRGFFASWHHNGLNQRVLAHVRAIISSRKTDSLADLRVIVTGHSLGGALATLAAHDLQTEFSFPQLHCYTFGAPRTGNHAFAAESSQLAPETWHVINDQDTIARFGKFWFAYKRSGHRCIITERGDILVRPFPLEQRLSLNLRGGKLVQHYLQSYVKAMVAICDAQFTAKQLKGGREGCLKMLEDPHVCQLLAAGGLSVARARRELQEKSSLRAHVLSSSTD